ncbi:peptidoglycan-binding protein [Lentimicrobium sp. S6]|uniref:peptidoglycan-binding domain-containing protein n=1 Tax=Lentimicrobium sp. S6 TaxID=2735872 RepID=UPI0015523674|nr:peptidoglycan-binding domain-containing protein [Lentimicrobium sp. S6]NPD47493.1 peptidoglycan-binding protein [Lentimicrobium sp. S6]
MKKNKKIIVFVVLLIIAVLVFVFKDKLFGTNTKTVSNLEPSNDNPQNSYFIKYGSRGNEVKLLQAYLNEFKNEALIVDGIWGPKTQAAFESFVASVDFVNSSKGVTKDEYKSLDPHYAFLSKKWFNTK